ncbi:glycosyltransferase [Citricoccus sp. GCM10030269]|uniref:glycosyltransferase n=1 Tax=Citricoccus sp. GCM10030269 TaxID=3273388 RepID=UPI00361BD147
MTAPSDRKLKVLIAADTYPPDVNGASVFCYRLARALHERGHEVHVIAARNEAGPDSVQYTDEATVHRLQSVAAPTHEYYRIVFPWHARKSIGALLDELRPDVVHVQCHYMIGEAAINEADQRRIRTIATNHFMPENLEPFLPFPQWFRDIVSKNSWRDMGRLMSKTAAVTTPTALAAKTMMEHAGLDDVLPISNGIDSAAYERAPGEVVERAEYPVVLFVGRLAVEKNVDVLIRALQLLDPALNVHLEIVGDGEQRTPLRELVDELGLQDRVHFLGHVSEADLHRAYLRAEVFCQPGTAELQSLVSLEAMSASRPVVLADALALPHLVTDGDNGYLFTPNDPQDLADKLTAVLTASDEERARMGRASHDRAVQHSQDKTIGLFEKLYRGATPAEVRELL